MTVTVSKIKQIIGQYLSQDKPEPNLVLLLGDSVDILAIDWLKKSGAKQEKEFWVISREQGKQALLPPSFDWDTHWEKEKEYREQEMRRGVKNVN